MGRVDKGEKLSFTQKMYGWSKYGGGRHGLVKEDLDEWYCQVCAQKQVSALPNYMFDQFGDKRDFIRVCSKCKHKAVKKKIERVQDLFRELRREFVEDTWE